ncbi:hypothetical protein [Sphingobium lactosutens]|uniref:Uncharacterized protein n=1 Tax=Sphingobium lactosutens DS20 TaxID=1331060 RepID=T0HKE2_9SPHN|nr:hypothetical protein [Sphingobium lactosutens]EQB16786.1 hypothetical protein RLDS_06620 [Sphingobium lactosutens DS20]
MTTPDDTQTPSPAIAPGAPADEAIGDTSARPALLDLRAQWSKLTSDQKLRAKQLGVVSTIALLGFGLYTASTSGKQEAPKAPQASNLDMGAGLRGDSLEVKLRGDLQKILDGQSLLGDRVTAIEEGKVVAGAGLGSHASAGGDGGDLPPAIPGEAPAYPPAPAGAQGAADEIPMPPSPPAAPPAPPAPPTERQVGAIGAATATQTAEGGAGSSPSSKKRMARPVCK